MRNQHQPTTPIEPLLVRLEEAVRILSLSRSTIYQMLDRDELPSVCRGTARRIPLAALRAWVERLTTTIPLSVRASTVSTDEVHRCANSRSTR
jgi:excisionase family DNA binding protein